MAGPGRVRRVELREPENALDRAIEVGIVALLMAGAVSGNPGGGLSLSQWANRLRPSPFFELGPTWVVGTHYTTRASVGKRIEFDQVVTCNFVQGTSKKSDPRRDFHWYLCDENDASTYVSGPTLAKAVPEVGYLLEIRQLMWFANRGIRQRLGQDPGA